MLTRCCPSHGVLFEVAEIVRELLYMLMHCLPERVIRQALGAAIIADIRYTNTAAKDFNGKLVYLDEPLRSGYVGRQYCVKKLTRSIG